MLLVSEFVSETGILPDLVSLLSKILRLCILKYVSFNFQQHNWEVLQRALSSVIR